MLRAAKRGREGREEFFINKATDTERPRKRRPRTNLRLLISDKGVNLVNKLRRTGSGRAGVGA